MQSRGALVVGAFLSLSCFACSDGSEDSKIPAASWSRLVEGTWTLGPGEESERLCFKKVLTEDVYISAIRPVHPLGTHHTILTMGEGDCTAAVVNGLVYAAAVGTQGLTLPPGVAIKLPAGETLNLGLHIYNVGQKVIHGTSAIEIVTMKPEDVEFESETVLAGPLTLAIPPRRTTTIQHDCPVTTDTTVYALFPHMHRLGTHIKTVFERGGTPSFVRDEPFDFEEQIQIPLDPAPKLFAGDTVHTECTFQNDTDELVQLGESTDTEMCFSVLFRYPAGGGTFCGL
jgi:hypothetical protein